MSIGRASGRSWCQATLCWQARSITQRPIGWISPLSSATGMKSEGSIIPRFGWSQRSSASSAGISPLPSATIGW